MKNIGIVDRIIRGILGLGIIYLALVIYPSSMILSIVLFILAIIVIIQSIIGFCLIYKIFKINTNKGASTPDSYQQQNPQQPQSPQM